MDRQQNQHGPHAAHTAGDVDYEQTAKQLAAVDDTAEFEVEGLDLTDPRDNPPVQLSQAERDDTIASP